MCLPGISSQVDNESGEQSAQPRLGKWPLDELEKSSGKFVTPLLYWCCWKEEWCQVTLFSETYVKFNIKLISNVFWNENIVSAHFFFKSSQTLRFEVMCGLDWHAPYRFDDCFRTVTFHVTRWCQRASFNPWWQKEPVADGCRLSSGHPVFHQLLVALTLEIVTCLP